MFYNLSLQKSFFHFGTKLRNSRGTVDFISEILIFTMKISNLTKRNLRYNGCTNLSSFSSHGWPSVSSVTHSSTQSSKCLGFSSYSYTSLILNLFLISTTDVGCRFYSVSSVNSSQNKKLRTDKLRPKAASKQVLKIINLLSSNQENLESKLDFLTVRLSVASASLIFQALNRMEKPALDFFYWIRSRYPNLGCNSDICSLVIDNCGSLNDYDAMQGLLYDFRLDGLSLTKRAFEYLPVMAATEAKMRESTQSVVDILKKVGGTTYVTGIRSLIEMFSVLGSFNMAKFVIDKTERRLSYYNLLIKEMCRRCEFEGARNVIDEMSKEGCDPTAQIYNNVISALLKNGESAEACNVFQEMIQKDCIPDAITFEIFIYHCCHDGKLDIAFQFFDNMMARGLQPRLLTHAVFIKGFFNSKKYEEAYKYVADSNDKYSTAQNYSLLARLHQKRGNLVAAENILSEMINKGLRPNFSVCRSVKKHLQKAGKKELATDLQEKLHQLDIRA